jgi:hypothetical protein
VLIVFPLHWETAGFALSGVQTWGCNAGFAAESQVAQLAVQHLQIRAFSAPAVMVLLVVNGAFRGFRDTKWPPGAPPPPPTLALALILPER